MKYNGKLYGKIGNKYFDTSKTSDDYDNLEKQNKALLDEIELVNNINGKLNDNNIKLLDEIERLKFELDNIKIESSHEISDLVKTQQETQKQLDDTFHQLEGSIKHVEQLQSDLKAADSVNENQIKLNESILKYSENQRKIIVLLLEGIEEVKGHLPFATNLKLTEIVNVSQAFTKPLPNQPK